MARSIAKIVTMLQSNQDGLSGSDLNALLDHIRDCECPELLLPTLRNPNSIYIDSAVWISSEIGALSKSLESELSDLLENECDRIRYYSIEAIQNFDELANDRSLYLILKHLEDHSPFVCAKSALFVTLAPSIILERGLAVFENMRSGSTINLHGAYLSACKGDFSPAYHLISCSEQLAKVFGLGCIFRDFQGVNKNRLSEYFENDSFMLEAFNFMYEFMFIMNSDGKSLS